MGLFTGGRFYIRRKHALEVSYSYTETEFLRRTDFPTAVVFTILPLEVQGVAFNYVVYIFPRGRLRTFATGGLGFTVYDGGPDFKRTRFTGNFGGGLDIRLHGPLSARLEIRDFLSKRLRLSSTLDPDGIANNLVASAGLAVRF